MLISSSSCEILRDRILSDKEVFCRGIYLSARWFVLSQIINDSFNLIVLPNREAAEYCCADLYYLIEGDSVFFLPTSGKNIERSNYKSTLGVQRTAAIEKVLKKSKEKVIIVTYPDALEENVPTIKGIIILYSPIRNVIAPL